MDLKVVGSVGVRYIRANGYACWSGARSCVRYGGYGRLNKKTRMKMKTLKSCLSFDLDSGLGCLEPS